MKTMKGLKQQIATALSLALVVMAIAVCAPDQALAQNKTGVVLANEQSRNNVRQRSQSGRGVIMANDGGYPIEKARRQNNADQPNHFAAPNYTSGHSGMSGAQRVVAADFNGDHLPDAVKAGSASSQSQHTAPQVNKPRRYLEQGSIYQ